MNKKGIRNVILFWLIILLLNGIMIYDEELVLKIIVVMVGIGLVIYASYLVYIVSEIED